MTVWCSKRVPGTFAAMTHCEHYELETGPCCWCGSDEDEGDHPFCPDERGHRVVRPSPLPMQGVGQRWAQLYHDAQNRITDYREALFNLVEATEFAATESLWIQRERALAQALLTGEGEAPTEGVLKRPDRRPPYEALPPQADRWRNIAGALSSALLTMLDKPGPDDYLTDDESRDVEVALQAYAEAVTAENVQG